MAERFFAHVNLAAIRENIQLLKQHAAPARVMAVVKANAYGLGMAEVSKAALDGGADALGVVTVDEALRLRAAGFSEVPILCWLLLPDSDFAAAIKQKVTIAVSTPEQLQAVLRAGESLGIIPQVQLKVDTGLNRNGAHPDDWPVLMEAIHEASERSQITFEGMFSHLALADTPDMPGHQAQLDTFQAALDMAKTVGLNLPMVHLANSAAALNDPSLHYDMVRIGIAMYGYPPVSTALPLRGSLSLQSVVVRTAHIKAGSGVSYGHEWRAESDTTVALIPIGYASGIPRLLSGKFSVRIRGKLYPSVGVICMDQFVVDLHGNPDGITSGDIVELIDATGHESELRLETWAERAQTISHEILTGFDGRGPFQYQR